MTLKTTLGILGLAATTLLASSVAAQSVETARDLVDRLNLPNITVRERHVHDNSPYTVLFLPQRHELPAEFTSFLESLGADVGIDPQTVAVQSELFELVETLHQDYDVGHVGIEGEEYANPISCPNWFRAVFPSTANISDLGLSQIITDLREEYPDSFGEILYIGTAALIYDCLSDDVVPFGLGDTGNDFTPYQNQLTALINSYLTTNSLISELRQSCPGEQDSCLDMAESLEEESRSRFYSEFNALHQRIVQELGIGRSRDWAGNVHDYLTRFSPVVIVQGGANHEDSFCQGLQEYRINDYGISCVVLEVPALRDLE